MKKLLVFILVLVTYVANSQNVVSLANGSGVSLATDELQSLESFAAKTLPSFTDENFKIVDASFYSYNDEMGEARESEIWESFKEEARLESTNFLLLGRQYFEDRSGFKLWIHLQVDIEALACYSPGDKAAISDNLKKAQQDIQDWYEYLSFKPETNGFDIIEDVAELTYYKLDKICCELGSKRNSCDPDKLDPQSIVKEKELKYYILGALKCMLFVDPNPSGDGNSCYNSGLDNESSLGSLTKDNLTENEYSLFYDDDFLPGLGYVHIYVNNDNYELNCIEPVIGSKDKDCTTGNAPQQVLCAVETKIYNLGKFTIVIESGEDLFEILKNLNHESDSLLPIIVSKLKGGNSLSDIEKSALLYSSYCNFEKITDVEKVEFLDVVTGEFDRDLWEFWRWYQPRYPLFIRQLYDGISDKRKLFEAHEIDIDVALRLIDYNFSDAITNSEFHQQYIEDYISLLTLSNGQVEFKGEYLGEVLFLPYNIEKTLAYHFSALGFKVNDLNDNKIDIIYSNPNWHFDLYPYGPPARHPFTAVYIEQINFPGFQSIGGVVPLVFLLNLQNHLIADAEFTTIMTGVDVISTVSLVGNVGKFRHLGRAKVFFSGVEITTSVGSQMLTYTNTLDDHPELKKKIQLILAGIEILSSVANGVTPSDIKKLQDEARDASKALDDLASDANDPKALLASHLRMLAGGKQALIDRIKHYVKADFITYIETLDDVTDATKIARFHILADSDAIRKVSNHIDPANYTKFGDDLVDEARGLTFTLYLRHQNPEGVKAWNRFIDAPDGIRLNLDLLDDVSTWPASWQIRQGTVNGTIEVLDGAGTPLARIFPDRVVASGRSVIGQPGNKILNRVPPIKNMTYEVDGIDYITDNLGRVVKTSGDLDDMVRVRLGNQQIRAVDVKDGVRGTDQGGHIIGARFFGAGEQINYYPQSANLNQGAWKTMENKWADEMVAGKDVKVEVNPIFNGSTGRPDAFEVNYWINNVKSTEFFDNL